MQSENSIDPAILLDVITQNGNLAWWQLDLPSSNMTFHPNKATMLGFAPTDFKVFNDFARLMNPPDYYKMIQAVKDHIEGRRSSYGVIYRIKTRFGDWKWIYERGKVVYKDDRGNFRLVGVVEDITRIQEAEKIQTEFISMAAHHLRTPLGGIRWNIEMILEGDFGPTPDGFKTVLKQIYESNLHLINLVGDLLNVSRIDQNRIPDQPEMVDIVNLIKRLLDNMQPQIEHMHLAVKLSPIGNLPKVRIDPNRLRQVLYHLISNAIKYNRVNGQIEIIINAEDKKLMLTIKDTGMGIPLADQNKVFTRFFRAANAVESEIDGNGLGLYIVEAFIRDWGGQISFDSQVGRGTTFYVEIPVEMSYT